MICKVHIKKKSISVTEVLWVLNSRNVVGKCPLLETNNSLVRDKSLLDHND